MKTNPTQHGTRAALLPLAAALLALGAQATAAPRFVMEIRDHKGNITLAGASQVLGHEGAIDVVSFGKSFSAASGLPSLDSTALTCGLLLDQTTPALLAATTAGTTFARVEIFLLGDESTTPRNAPAQVVLEHVQITSLDVRFGQPQTDGPDFATSEAPVAEMSLNFSKISWVYREQDEDGNTLSQSNYELTAFADTEDPGFDDDGDGLNNALDHDDDNDGIPDTWEKQNGTNALVADGGEDSDQDQQNNHAEWLAGTNPHDGSSFFAISAIAVAQTPEGRLATVSFPVIPERHYRLLGTLDPRLPREEWIVFNSFGGTPKGHADIVLKPGVLPQLGRLFFQVQVSSQPFPQP